MIGGSSSECEVGLNTVEAIHFLGVRGTQDLSPLCEFTSESKVIRFADSKKVAI